MTKKDSLPVLIERGLERISRVPPKKALWSAALIIGGLAAAGLVFTLMVLFSADTLIRTAILVAGPRILKCDVQLEEFKISPFSGKGYIRGLAVGNPKGFKGEFAFKVEEARIRIRPSSLFSEKLVIEEIFVSKPQIFYERVDLKRSNISTLSLNVQRFIRERSTRQLASDSTYSRPPGKKDSLPTRVQIGGFLVESGAIHIHSNLLPEGSKSVDLPDIEVEQLGSDEFGITGAEATRRILHRLSSAVFRTVSRETDIIRAGIESIKLMGQRFTGRAPKKTGRDVRKPVHKK